MNGARFPGAGSALLALIFTVLCLTVSALMSLSRAVSDRALSEKLASSVEAYYSADCLAAEKAAALCEAQAAGKSADDTALSFTVPESGSSVISVKLRQTESGFEILSWQLIYTEPWTPDEVLSVYSGEEQP